MTDVNNFQLYGAFGHSYDLHTPAHHYQHDHDFLIRKIREFKANARVLDIGCGSGIFLEKALEAKLDPIGLDPARAMLELASKKVGAHRVRLMGMECLNDISDFDVITALSWSLNYAIDVDQMRDTLHRIKTALRPGGRIFFQVAHAAHAEKVVPDFFVDKEEGPGGPNDITFKYRFSFEDEQTLRAEYHFSCHSTGNIFEEVHLLRMADGYLLAGMLQELGFKDIQLLENHREDPFEKSFNPFILARLPDA